jgi:hypothetical protein
MAWDSCFKQRFSGHVPPDLEIVCFQHIGSVLQGMRLNTPGSVPRLPFGTTTISGWADRVAFAGQIREDSPTIVGWLDEIISANDGAAKTGASAYDAVVP